jgi:pimeloyl-ACP methyl ester carboxylesterase
MRRALVLAAMYAAPIIALTPSSTASHSGSSKDYVTIETSDGVKLSGTFFAPRGKDRAPAALLVHDAGSDRRQLEGVAKKLQKKGFGVLTVDLRGHGDSKTSKVDWSALDKDAQSSLWQQAPRDVEASAEWLLGQRNVHSTNLSLVGYRAGCALVARHAERDENVISMLLLAPKPKDFGFDVEATINKVNGLPTCVIDHRNDETERMVMEANATSPFIEQLGPVPAKSTSVLDDSRWMTRGTAWLTSVAKPGK